MTEPKFNIGDLVYAKLERPKNALGHSQNTTNFRKGDFRFDVKNPKKIKRILLYPNNIRYLLEDKPNVSYTEQELKLAPDQTQVYEVQDIIDKRRRKGVIEYLVHWKGYKKNESTWEPLADLLVDGLKDEINRFENLLKKKQK
jgi:hypothetical protein